MSSKKSEPRRASDLDTHDLKEGDVSVIREAFNTHARYVPRRFKRSREKSVGASEIGQCARKIWYKKHDADYDADFIDGWGAAKRGKTFESRFFVPALRKHYGNKLLWAGSSQQRFTDKKLSATPDGLLIDQPRDALAELMVPDLGPSRCFAIECKTIDPRINLSEPKTENVFQTHVQLGMIRKFTKYKPDYAVIIYTNASFFDDNVEFVVRYDAEVFEHAHKRANQIMLSSLASDLKPEGWIAGGNECKYCPFAKACMALRGDVPDADKDKKADPQFIAEMVELAMQERELATHADEAKRDQREVQEKIKQRLRDKGLSSVKGSGISIVWSAIKGRPSYDMPGIKAAAAAAGINLQRFETVGEPSDRLTVNVTKQDRLVTPNRSQRHGE